MLRLIFVLAIIVAGIVFSVFGPFQALLFYLWNAYFRPESWTYGGLIYSLNLSFTIGVYLVIRTIGSLPSPRMNVGTVLILLFLGQCIVGTVTSEQPGVSQYFVREFAKVLIISYLIVVLVTSEKRFRWTLVVIGVSLGFELAKQGWADLVRSPGRVNANTNPFLGDNNGVALGSLMLVPILGALGRTASTRWERHFQRFFALGVLLRGLSTYSRGGFLAAAVMGVIGFVRSDKKLRALAVLAVIGFAVSAYMPREFWARMSTITVEEDERDESAAGRVHFWRVAVDMAAAKPLTGVGLGAFSLAYPSYNSDERFEGERAAHSTWFGVLGDLGYPGLVLFVALWTNAVWSCWRVSRACRKDAQRAHLGVYADGVLTSLAVFAVAGTFLSSQYNEMVWHFFGLSTALHILAFQPVPAAHSASAATPMASVRTGKFVAIRPL